MISALRNPFFGKKWPIFGDPEPVRVEKKSTTFSKRHLHAQNQPRHCGSCRGQNKSPLGMLNRRLISYLRAGITVRRKNAVKMRFRISDFLFLNTNCEWSFYSQQKTVEDSGSSGQAIGAA